MNQWPNGQQVNGMFQQGTQGHLNPASMYNNIGNGNSLDFSQFTHGLQNGNSGTPTPNYQNQTFQPGSVVPAKRTHDGMSGSPVQGQGSRSQTPNYGGFQNQQQAGQQFPNAPTPYSHLQQQSGSSNATPSPTMQNQQFRPPTQQQQRMPNASPSPFPSQQGNYNAQMSTSTPQPTSQPTSMPQQGQMGAFNQQYGANANAGMSASMQAQMNNMANMGQTSAQRAYQMKLMQHQQQLRANGMNLPRAVGGQQNQMFNGQQQMGGQKVNGQAGSQPNVNMTPQQQAQQAKKQAFMTTIAQQASQQGRPFNDRPTIGGRIVDLYVLWTLVTHLGGSQAVDRAGRWQELANRMGFTQPQYPTAAEELKQLHTTNSGLYERLWWASQAQKKQEQARNYAHQMAGFGGATQGSPVRQMQQQSQQNQFAQFQQGQQGQSQPQATPVQANAQLPQNGMSTPQQQLLQHRRNSSIRKQEMTPQAATQSLTAPSPQSAGKTQRSPSIKQEREPMKNEEPQSTNYRPFTLPQEEIWDNYIGGYDVTGLDSVLGMIAHFKPNMPSFQEMGVVDTKAVTLSLASGIHSEVRYALETLTSISLDPRIQFDLSKCEDLIDVIIDCAEDQIEILSEEAAEVSDALDLASYEDVMKASRVEADTLQDVPEFGTQAYDLDRAADRLIAVTTILRNFSFWEFNHRLLTSTPLIKWLSNTIRLLGTRNMLLRTHYNTQDFYKDMVIFLSNTTQSLELPSRDDALHILHFLLAFAPDTAPSYVDSGGKVRFMSFVATVHRYLPAAVDCLAKLLARQDPNRMFYRSIFTASSSSLAVSESPLDLLTRAFALSISVLPDRSKGAIGNDTRLKLVDARKAYLSQGMLAADILTTLVPSNDAKLARAWIDSEDGWTVGLVSLAALLSVHCGPPVRNPRTGEIEEDPMRLISQRALTMIKRLAEKAGKDGAAHVFGNGGTTNGTVVNGDSESGDREIEVPTWESIPQNHNIVGSLLLPKADNAALGLLCGLYDMAMQS